MRFGFRVFLVGLKEERQTGKSDPSGGQAVSSTLPAASRLLQDSSHGVDGSNHDEYETLGQPCWTLDLDALVEEWGRELKELEREGGPVAELEDFFLELDWEIGKKSRGALGHVAVLVALVVAREGAKGRT